MVRTGGQEGGEATLEAGKLVERLAAGSDPVLMFVEGTAEVRTRTTRNEAMTAPRGRGAGRPVNFTPPGDPLR